MKDVNKKITEAEIDAFSTKYIKEAEPISMKVKLYRKKKYFLRNQNMKVTLTGLSDTKNNLGFNLMGHEPFLYVLQSFQINQIISVIT